MRLARSPSTVASIVPWIGVISGATIIAPITVAVESAMTPAEAIIASTVNAAHVLGFKDRATVTPGARADLILLTHTDERALAQEIGGDPVDVVLCGGEPVKDRRHEIEGV